MYFSEGLLGTVCSVIGTVGTDCVLATLLYGNGLRLLQEKLVSLQLNVFKDTKTIPFGSSHLKSYCFHQKSVHNPPESKQELFALSSVNSLPTPGLIVLLIHIALTDTSLLRHPTVAGSLSRFFEPY